LKDYKLKILIKNATNLSAFDWGGTSDPYVKVKVNDK
jgi:Ca2+-dependent lipid-binding protein